MNAKDRKNVSLVRKLADDLLNQGPREDPSVRTIDVLEELIGDLAAIENGSEPTYMVALVERAIREDGFTRPDYLPKPYNGNDVAKRLTRGWVPDFTSPKTDRPKPPTFHR